jgi:transcriptional regulator with XRE-family HTH domain
VTWPCLTVGVLVARRIRSRFAATWAAIGSQKSTKPVPLGGFVAQMTLLACPKGQDDFCNQCVFDERIAVWRNERIRLPALNVVGVERWLALEGTTLKWKVSEMKHPVDVHVGKRIRHRRWMNGTTQQQLAEKVGIKFQQIQKYETGMNRVSASRLWDIAAALGVQISFFFEGLGAQTEDDSVAGSDMPGDILSDREALELLRSYYAIPENQRRRLFDLARVLSEAA